MNNAQIKVTYTFATAASTKTLVRIYATFSEAVYHIQEKQKLFADLDSIKIENL